MVSPQDDKDNMHMIAGFTIGFLFAIFAPALFFLNPDKWVTLTKMSLVELKAFIQTILLPPALLAATVQGILCSIFASRYDFYRRPIDWTPCVIKGVIFGLVSHLIGIVLFVVLRFHNDAGNMIVWILVVVLLVGLSTTVLPLGVACGVLATTTLQAIFRKRS